MVSSIVPDPERSLGFLVHDVARLLRRSFNRGVEPLGLTQTQWRAIAQLSRNEGINQVTLADVLEVQPISLGRMLDRMQEAGIIERRPDPNDRRAVQLYLADAAKPILEGLRRQASRVQDQAVGDMPDDDFEQLVNALQILKRNLLAADSERDERKAAKASSKE